MDDQLQEIFCDIKECLLSFNYPLAHCMNDIELADVFRAKNRCFLVSWMIKLYLGDNVNLTAKENNGQILGDLIHELGFCKKEHSLSFMKGDVDLIDINTQIEILYKMFKSIKSVKSSINQECKNPLSFGEVTSMVKSPNELNLFPMYGDIKLANPIETDSNTIEKRCSENDTSIIEERCSLDNGNATIMNGMIKDIESLLDQVQEELAKMELVSKSIPHTISLPEQDFNKIVHHPDSSELLRSCVNHAKQINQFLENINKIEKFMEYDNISNNEKTDIEGSQGMLRALYEEIVITLRYQQMKS